MTIWRPAFLSWAGFLLLTLVACSPAARQRAGSVARGAAAGAAGASAQQYSTKLMIFGILRSLPLGFDGQSRFRASRP